MLQVSDEKVAAKMNTAMLEAAKTAQDMGSAFCKDGICPPIRCDLTKLTDMNLKTTRDLCMPMLRRFP